MGLMKRKKQAPIIGLKTYGGLPGAQKEHDDALSSSSRMAAQAAATLAHSHQQQQQQQQQHHEEHQQQRQPPPKRMSRAIVASSSSKSIATQKQKRKSFSVSQASSPIHTRAAPLISSHATNTTAAATAAAMAASSHDLNIENLSLQDSDNALHDVHPGAMNIASLAAHSAALSSSEFLAPPLARRSSYHSSPSSMASSMHSLDSPPFYAKIGGLTGTRSDEFFANLNRSGSVVSDFDPRMDFGEEFEWLDRSASSIRSSTSASASANASATKLNGRTYATSSIPLNGRNINHRANETIDEMDELDGNEADNEVQNQSPPPSPVFQGEEDQPRGRQLSNVATIDNVLETPPLPTDSFAKPQSPIPIRKGVPSRKPPPLSPDRVLTSDSTTLTVPLTIPPRAPSPRRKPPPGFEDDSMAEDSTMMDDSMMESDYNSEVLPQYPMGFGDSMEKKSHRSLRKGAKKILKKGLKGSSYTPSNFLNESDASLSATVGGFIGLHGSSSKPVHLKTTMRKEKKKEIFNEEKPWKHHTDTAFVSKQERKRYEGVWVSNKGLYMDKLEPSTLLHDVDVPGQLNTALKASMLSMKADIGAMEANLITNLVVREIWSRSRLPNDTLQKVWELVDTRHDGTLDRTSFIVGMWLVDQCLYGRKLPREVSEAVWNSVTHIGLNVVLVKKKK